MRLECSQCRTERIWLLNESLVSPTIFSFLSFSWRLNKKHWLRLRHSSLELSQLPALPSQALGPQSFSSHHHKVTSTSAAIFQASCCISLNSCFRLNTITTGPHDFNSNKLYSCHTRTLKHLWGVKQGLYLNSIKSDIHWLCRRNNKFLLHFHSYFKARSYASHKKVSKQMEEQLDAVNRRLNLHYVWLIVWMNCWSIELESSASWYATWRRSFCPTTGEN